MKGEIKSEKRDQQTISCTEQTISYDSNVEEKFNSPVDKNLLEQQPFQLKCS